MTTLALDTYRDRCRHGWHIPTQGCVDCGTAQKFSTLAAVAASPSAVKSQLEAAIRRHAASGLVFSMNDLRGEVPAATGPVVGAVFGALSQAHVIVHIGYTPSSKPNTKAHDIKTWRGRAA